MRAERGGAVRVGAAEREIHAALDILGAPARHPVAPDGVERRRKVPSGFGMRGQMWPLSMCVWQSTKAGQTIRPNELHDRIVVGVPRLRRTARTFRRPRTMSTSDEPVAVRPGRRIVERARPARSRSSGRDGSAAGDSRRLLATLSSPASPRSRATSEEADTRRGWWRRRSRRRCSERSTSAAKRRGMFSRCCASIRRKARPESSPGGAGGELGDDGGDQRQAAGDPQAREEIGEGVRQPQMDQASASGWRRKARRGSEDCGRSSAGPARCWRGPGRRRRARRRSGAPAASCCV